ncbi:MAG: hypothetical protein AAF489_14300 [Bacteroidota bacterium]
MLTEEQKTGTRGKMLQITRTRLNLALLLAFTLFAVAITVTYHYTATSLSIECCVSDPESRLNDRESKEGALLARSVAKARSELYKNERATNLELRLECMGDTETRTESELEELADNLGFNFNLTKLRHYLCYVEDNAPDLVGSEDFSVDNLGIRVYLGGEQEMVGGSLVMRTGIFLAPTYSTESPSTGGEPRMYIDIDGIQLFDFAHSRRPPRTFMAE